MAQEACKRPLSARKIAQNDVLSTHKSWKRFLKVCFKEKMSNLAIKNDNIFFAANRWKVGFNTNKQWLFFTFCKDDLSVFAEYFPTKFIHSIKNFTHFNLHPASLWHVHVGRRKSGDKIPYILEKKKKKHWGRPLIF